MVLTYLVLKHMDMDMPQALLPRFHALTIGPGLGRATGTGEDGERNYCKKHHSKTQQAETNT